MKIVAKINKEKPDLVLKEAGINAKLVRHGTIVELPFEEDAYVIPAGIDEFIQGGEK